jgi:hypothetical protein
VAVVDEVPVDGEVAVEESVPALAVYGEETLGDVRRSSEAVERRWEEDEDEGRRW